LELSWKGLFELYNIMDFLNHNFIHRNIE